MQVCYSILPILALAHLSCGSLLGKVVWKQSDKARHVGRMSILHKPYSVEFVKGAGAIPFDEISSVFTLALGFSVYKDLKWHGLLSGNPFSRPKALLTFSVNNVPSGKVLKVDEMERFQIIADEQPSLEHLLSLEDRNSVANHISSYFNKLSLTTSVAASEEVASSGHSESESGRTAFLDLRDGSWRYFSGENVPKISQATLDKVLHEYFTENNFDNIRLIKSEKKVSLKTVDGTTVFDLSKPEARNFFNEVAAIVLVAQKSLSKRSLITDGNTDVFSFSFTTLEGIEHVYGANTAQVKAASKLVEEVIKSLEKSFKKAYNGNILIAAVTLDQEKSAFSEDQVNNVYKKLKGELNGLSYEMFQKHFPSLHLLEDVEEKARRKLCESVQGKLSTVGGDFKFKCVDEDDRVHFRRKRSLLAVKDGSNAAKDDTDDLNLASFYDEDFPVIFNIWFWLLVILFLSVYVISLIMWYMDPGKDSIIYRMTSHRIKTE